MSNNKKFRILSIDGGGLRGMVPLMVLEKIEKETGGIIKMWELTNSREMFTTQLVQR